MISKKPYVFQRTYSEGDYADAVVVGLDLFIGKKEIDIASIFENGTRIKDAYSGEETVVKNGKVIIDTEYKIVLFEKNK